ncbi:MAG: HDOD domain-containing protein [Fibromonadaceae bacterium]|nr:HDOD domain-containing protein [Fibromonadaceae bacterium]
MDEICVARQPIMNRDRELFGYELVFKGIIEDELNTTAHLVDNLMSTVGIEKMAGNEFAFLNCDYDFLLSEAPQILNPEVFILEIYDKILIDDKIIETIKQLHGKGFKIALDDFELTKQSSALIAPIIPCLSFCKFGYSEVKNPGLLPKLIEVFHKYKIEVITKKIETMTDFKLCYKSGSDFFQGYFFAKAENAKPVKIRADTVGALRVLNQMSGNYMDVDIGSLESEFKKYPDLTVNLLKYLNTAAFGVRCGITSIRHALSMLGLSRIKKWLLILAYDNNSNVSLEKSPLLVNAMMRANFFVSMAKKLSWSAEKTEKAYLMGLVSHLDALYQTTYENILEQISLDVEIARALLEGAGAMGLLLNIISIIEQGDIEDASEYLEALMLSRKDVNECLISAYTSSLSVT